MGIPRGISVRISGEILKRNPRRIGEGIPETILEEILTGITDRIPERILDGFQGDISESLMWDFFTMLLLQFPLQWFSVMAFQQFFLDFKRISKRSSSSDFFQKAFDIYLDFPR